MAHPITRFASLVSRTTALASVLFLQGCGGTQDDTDVVQQAVDQGGVVTFEARTYYLSRTIVVRHSNTVIQGVGPNTIFQFKANTRRVHCVNDRVFTTPCDRIDQAPRRITSSIAVGDRSFSTSADLSDLHPGDWLLLTELDAVIGGQAAVDWMQVDSISEQVVTVRTPFRTAFVNKREWDTGRRGLGFWRIDAPVENTVFRNFNITVPDAGLPEASAAGISVFAALHTTIDRVQVDDWNAQPLYSYLSKDLTITNSAGRGQEILNEFAATVDLTLRGNSFGVAREASLGLNVGTAFFDVSGNTILVSCNIGAYMLPGVHDGIFSNNQIAFVGSTSDNINAMGLLAWGTQNVEISTNYLEGGEGPQSTGISVRGIMGEIPMPSVNVRLRGNMFGGGWVLNYEAGTVPEP